MRKRLTLVPSLPRRAFLVLAIVVFFAPSPSRAGDLVFYESASGPGTPKVLTPPASNAVLDLDYAPDTAEGGGLYGFSELTIIATGDLTLTSAGLSCQTYGCLYAPSPFTGGSTLTLSGADQLTGEFSSSQDLLTLSVSGSLGYVVIVHGHYVDASGPGQTLGAIQETTPTIIAVVPEPGFGMTLLAATLALASSAGRRQR